MSHVKAPLVISFGRCTQTGKRRFTFDGAHKVARTLRRRQGTNHAPYRCTSCGDWHVGSSETGRHSRRTETPPRTPRPQRLSAAQFIEVA